VRPDDDRMTVETCCLSWPSYVNKYMYCCADVHFMVVYNLLGVPHLFDWMKLPCVNEEKRKFKRKMGNWLSIWRIFHE